jgi:hypothetical protein
LHKTCGDLKFSAVFGSALPAESTDRQSDDVPWHGASRHVTPRRRMVVGSGEIVEHGSLDHVGTVTLEPHVRFGSCLLLSASARQVFAPFALPTGVGDGEGHLAELGSGARSRRRRP